MMLDEVKCSCQTRPQGGNTKAKKNSYHFFASFPPYTVLTYLALSLFISQNSVDGMEIELCSCFVLRISKYIFEKKKKYFSNITI